ncbi:MAG: carbohydrate ABC transporter permease [Trueperaceae bacterium]|nr:carbohydrate ABC transporter permease [Trueperaceae bacterium]
MAATSLRRRTRQLPAMLAAFFVCFVFAIPFLWMILTSLKLPSELFTSPVQVLPRSGVYWEAYTRIWTAGQFGRYFWNSTLVASIATGASVALSVFAAIGFARYKLRGGNYLLLGVLLSQLFPLVLLVPPFYAVMRELRILDTHLALVIAYTSFSLPFSIWMLTGYFRSIPAELEESAMIDGATRLGAQLRVILPLAGPGIAATVIYSFILAWNEFLFATTFISSPELRTLPIGLQSFIGQYSTDWNLLMAGAVVTTVPVIVLFVFLQRYLVAGLTAGAVKG